MTSQPHTQAGRRDRAHLIDDGKPLEEAIRASDMTLGQISATTRRLDAGGRGVSLALVGFLVSRGRSRRTSCGSHSARLIARALGQPAEELFVMPKISTLRMKGKSNAAAHQG